MLNYDDSNLHQCDVASPPTYSFRYIEFDFMKFPRVNSPAVWIGNEIFERDDWHQELLSEELSEIDSWLNREPSDRSTVIGKAINLRMQTTRRDLEDGCGATRIRGFDSSKYSNEQLSDFFLAMSRMVGTPLSQSAEGEKVFSVRNAGYSDDDPRARGPNTKKTLSFHTDRCDVIGFLCVRQAKSGGENQLVSSPAVYNAILDRRPELLRTLTQPYFYQRHTIDTANELPYTQQPIFSFFKGEFAANFLRVLIERAHSNPALPDMTHEQSDALDFLEEVAADPEMHVTFRQEPGDIVFMNNWITLHRRSEFEDYPEPDRRRHILRVWLSMPNSRAVDPMFAGNYGSTEAGAIRGGIKSAQSGHKH